MYNAYKSADKKTIPTPYRFKLTPVFPLYKRAIPIEVNNIEEIRIIHGKGTGALRSAVTDYLKTHPNVSEYRLGRYGEGELCAAGGKSSRRRPRSHFPFRPAIGSYDRSGCLCFFVPYLGSICSGGAWSVEKA